jgi:RNA polymerase sigma-70 factor (ECF subfamily)
MLRDPMPMETDQSLIERTLQGDLAAFEHLVQRHRNIVFRVAARIVGPDDAEDVSQDAFRQPVTELERRERQQRLEFKLRTLRPEYRSLLVLRDLEGLSYSEISDVLEMPLGSVKGRLHRARDELIDLLRNNTYDWELPA